ncbi:hypothetical protein ABB37_05393 [Leptomonas pyrrhocoris]|uniref:Uncharacterized protein n=1 Tax=Leptomonas pyrrhocoris TaxID=157538 RepID=A0A0M9G0C6_LEPPY|nr:hypothetical protein ABB37_05393 [Leptomonas pyrrhocoris]KPA79587.1 hypothetical protein ABB37_05393 [Leptomonas pyrrhocoris]|eukprot:XP_015658026.1 hypothetical protein ABB37_05393 [Leptomonas pyrrhocoris]
MWSMFSQDFTDFAKVFQSESAGFVDYLGHMAADVVGRGDVYAGDEVLKTTQSMPLPIELLQRLQEAEATYSLPIQPEEKDAFAVWRTANPLSSVNAQRRQAAEASDDLSKSEGGSPPGKVGMKSPPPRPAVMTPNRRSSEWPDEPNDETRQRLLDYNDVVLQRYIALVGDAVSPRSSIPASPATPDTRRRLTDPPSSTKLNDDDDGAAGGKAGEEGKSRTAVGGGVKPPIAPLSPSPSRAATATGHVISEDDFFDRYFFRLTQLRVSEAQRRRDRAALDSADASPVAASAQRAVTTDNSVHSATPTSPQSPSPYTNANDASRRSSSDDFDAVPLFAKRMMTAASGFVTNIDNALNNVVAAETSQCRGAGVNFNRVDSEDESANVDPSELQHFRGTKQKIADLESLVQELQETLRHERRRVQQLTAALVAHNVELPAELPASTTSTPAKGVTATVTPLRHVDPTPAPGAPAAAAKAKSAETSRLSGGGASPAASTAAAASREEGTADEADAHHSPAEARKGNGVISVGSEEEDDDEAWVSVSPSAEQSVP